MAYSSEEGAGTDGSVTILKTKRLIRQTGGKRNLLNELKKVDVEL